MEYGKTAKAIGETAVRALIYEVAVSPKPGLVDRFNNGAHRDMDFYTFVDSALALRPFFEMFAEAGLKWKNETAAEAFRRLRPIGLAAEERMLSVTGGINTHRGAIFSMGILCAALGRVEGCGVRYDESDIFRIAGTLGTYALDDFKTGTAAVYSRFHLTGARGEAARGFPHIRNCALPVYRNLRAGGYSVNDAGAVALLHLIVDVDDTNVAMRVGIKSMEELKAQTARLLANGIPSMDDISRLDQRLIDAYISPGGCADLLAGTLFLDFWREQAK